MSRRLAVRLPLLFAVALGAWLWRSDLFSQPRELVILLPSPAARVDVQLYAAGGELLAREERSFPPGAQSDNCRSGFPFPLRRHG